MTTCIDDKREEVVDICATLRFHILEAMQAFSKIDVCPTCGLYAIASTLGMVFKDCTDVRDDEIIKIGMAGLGNACNTHIEVLAEGSIN